MQHQISNKQLMANRKNAKQSTGPKSAEGKAKSSRNALKLGMLVKSVPLTMACFNENQEDYYNLLSRFFDECQPVGVVEEMMVGKIATSYWLLGRAARAEKGEVEKSWIERKKQETSRDEFIELVSEETKDLVPMESVWRKTTQGINKIVDVLNITESEVQRNGYVSEPTQTVLFQVFGSDKMEIASVAKMYSNFAKKGDQLREEDPEKYKKVPSAEECKNAMYELLVMKYGYYESMMLSLQESERMEDNVNALCMSIPSSEVSAKILRYTAEQNRQLYKALDQLERLQRQRKGERLIPPINVNLRSDA